MITSDQRLHRCQSLQHTVRSGRSNVCRCRSSQSSVNWLLQRSTLYHAAGPTAAATLVSGSLDATIRVWPLSRNQSTSTAVLRGHGGEVKCLAQLSQSISGTDRLHLVIE